MNALVLDVENRTANLQVVHYPLTGVNDILVRVQAISLNPIDPLYVSNPLASSGRTIGSDFAGVVAAVGDSVPADGNIKVGDRVAGLLQGACSVNERPGAFAEFLVIRPDLVWKVPDGVAIEEAAGVSLVALTAAQGMWYRLGLTSPFLWDKEMLEGEYPEWTKYPLAGWKEPRDHLNMFINGASTSVGLYAAQMVRLSVKACRSGKKLRLFGTASKVKWEMLKAEPYGYEHLVDYKDSDWPEQIHKLSDGEGMLYAYDCISEGDSVKQVSSLLVPGGRSVVVRSRAGGAWQADKLPFEPIYGAVWEALGEEVEYQGFTVKKSPAARHFAKYFYEWLSGALGSTLRPNPIRIMPGGLEKVVQDGFRLLGSGKMEERESSRTEEWMKPVSGEKLVYKI